MEERLLKIGDIAPDFTLQNQHKVDVNLKALRGNKVLLSFHPLAWTRICDIQMRSLEAKNEELKRLNIIALGISVDSQPCKKEWADYMKISKTDLLADFWPHGDVAKKYDIFIEKSGISGRANFLIDEEGKIVFIKIYGIPEIPDIEEIIRFAMK